MDFAPRQNQHRHGTHRLLSQRHRERFRQPGGSAPLPTGSGQLENLNAYGLNPNQTGAVLAEGPGLVIFDVEYGPGATIDSPPDQLGLPGPHQ